jgi:hypothetical protein
MTSGTSLAGDMFELSSPDFFQDTTDMSSIQGDFYYDAAQRYLSIREQSQQDMQKNQPDFLSATTKQEDKEITSLFPVIPKIRSRITTFTPLQEWEGYVLEIGKETFTARLIDLTTDSKQEEEEADFHILDLSDTDKQLLQVGAIFRWAIGYRRTNSGSKERVSSIVFRRLPAWTDREIKENQKKAKKLSATLQGE